MPTNILVATPHPAFGELLRLSLEESGQFMVRLVRSGKEAEASTANTRYGLAILDSDVPDQAFTAVAQSLRSQMPDIRLIIIPPENNPQHPSLSNIAVDGFLGRPFYLPDLMEMVDRLIGGQSIEDEPLPLDAQVEPQHAWAKDAGQAKLALTRLLPQSKATALFINHARQPWADSGNLSDAIFQEASGILGRSWDFHANTDLVRFVRLADGSDFLLYGTLLAGDWVLGLLLENNASLITSRNEAAHLAITLMNLPEIAPETPPEATTAVETVATPATEIVPEEFTAPVVGGELPPPPLEELPSVPEIEDFPAPTSAEEMPPLETPITEELPSPVEEVESAPAVLLEELLPEEPPGETPVTADEIPPVILEPGAAVPAEPVAEALPPAPDLAAILAEDGDEEITFPEEEESGEFNAADLERFLAELPPPDPGKSSEELPPGWLREDDLNGEQEYLFPWEQEERFLKNHASEPPIETPAEPLPEWLQAGETSTPHSTEQSAVELPDWLQAGTQPPVAEQPAQPPVIPQPEEIPDWALEETQPIIPHRRQPAEPARVAEAALPAESLPEWLFAEEAALSSRLAAPVMESQPPAPDIPAPAAEPLPPVPAPPLSVNITAPVVPPPPVIQPASMPAEPTPQPASPKAAAGGHIEDTQPKKVVPISTTDPILSIWLQPSAPPAPAPQPPRLATSPAIEDTQPRKISKPPTGPLPVGSQPLSIYTCMLIPAHPKHYLVGRLVADLNQWVIKIHEHHGWQCRGLAIRPQHIHWTTHAPPGFTGEKIAATIREATSYLILERNPRLLDDLGAGSFWAADPLILRGMHTPSQEIVKNFIAKTRTQPQIS